MTLFALQTKGRERVFVESVRTEKARSDSKRVEIRYAGIRYKAEVLHELGLIMAWKFGLLLSYLGWERSGITDFSAPSNEASSSNRASRSGAIRCRRAGP